MVGAMKLFSIEKRAMEALSVILSPLILLCLIGKLLWSAVMWIWDRVRR